MTIREWHIRWDGRTLNSLQDMADAFMDLVSAVEQLEADKEPRQHPISTAGRKASYL